MSAAPPFAAGPTVTFVADVDDLDEPRSPLDDRPVWKTVLLIAAPALVWTAYVTAGMVKLNEGLGGSMCCLSGGPTEEAVMAGLLVSQVLTVLYLLVLGATTLLGSGTRLLHRVVGSAVPSGILGFLLGTILLGI